MTSWLIFRSVAITFACLSTLMLSKAWNISGSGMKCLPNRDQIPGWRHLQGLQPISGNVEAVGWHKCRNPSNGYLEPATPSTDQWRGSITDQGQSHGNPLDHIYCPCKYSGSFCSALPGTSPGSSWYKLMSALWKWRAAAAWKRLLNWLAL